MFQIGGIEVRLREQMFDAGRVLGASRAGRNGYDMFRGHRFDYEGVRARVFRGGRGKNSG